MRKGADKLLKMMSAKQQGRLDTFFTVQPKSPEKKGKGQAGKSKPSVGKRKVNNYGGSIFSGSVTILLIDADTRLSFFILLWMHECGVEE